MVERARRDPEAFGALFDAYHPRIFTYALRRTGSPADADDIAAETFRTAFEKLWQFRWRGLPFSAWLYRIAANAIHLHFRRGLKRPTVPLEALDGDAEPVSPIDLKEELERMEEDVERQAQAREARELLLRLPRAYQDAVALRYFEGKGIAEIAAILGKKEGTVKSLVSRGIAKLRETMQPPGAARIVEDERSPSAPVLTHDQRP